MEFGNIGNYYILEPMIRQLHAAFPMSTIRTTFQLSDRFCTDENIQVLPMELYYGWTGKDLNAAEAELAITEEYKKSGRLNGSTAFIAAVEWADLVVDFSGDIWGDNANFLGPNRFEVGLMKDQVAMNLGKKTAMIAGSPGPFTDDRTRELAKQVYAGFDLVTNRESISTELLKENGFDISRTKSLACPAFLFEPLPADKTAVLLARENISREFRSTPVVGFVLCGWNFLEGPFDKWPRADAEYRLFAEAVEYISEKLGAKVVLLSHSNGFDVPVVEFSLKHGRDYPVIKQLQKVIAGRGSAKNVVALDGVYDAWESKAIIGSFDMLVSGRVHAAVAGLSQLVPTVIIDYGHEPKAHKLRGFAQVAGAQNFVADPAKEMELVKKIEMCWTQRKEYRQRLKETMPHTKHLSEQNFVSLQQLFSTGPDV
ncbi:MAG: polysaccharide pyruvyl transferase family protein [Chromatiaceae bacterium]|nr:polysaccharide pyruvyl transferase family protein [Chromatiaceae bacterium]MCP5315197.1 polysaccharide pyruvyl transferase family protein [Chromatiaceae bacterium]